jgi:hypothetical protein
MTSVFNFFEKIFYIIFQSPIFIIQIKENGLAIVKGKPNSVFVNDCKEIVSRMDINNGFIYATKNHYGNTIIKGSFNISKDVLQQIRNVWQFS